jgi:hypothetical protein
METQAEYRFLVQESDILQPHITCTKEHMRTLDIILCLHGATGLNFNGQEIAGLGPLSYEAQRGMYAPQTRRERVFRAMDGNSNPIHIELGLRHSMLE